MGTLRRIFRPFLKAVHPDLLHQAPPHVKRTNEQSMQLLNTIIDTLEHLGGGRSSPSASSQDLSLTYDLAFYIRRGTSNSSTLRSFTARLLFPPTMLSRFSRDAPLCAPAAGAEEQRGAAKPIPADMAAQLRKLFEGAKVSVPDALSGGSGGCSGPRVCRRGRMVGEAEAHHLLMQDLLGRDLRPWKASAEEEVSRFMRSGRVLVRGLRGHATAAEVEASASPPWGAAAVNREVAALADLRAALVAYSLEQEEEEEGLGSDEPVLPPSLVLVVDGGRSQVGLEPGPQGRLVIAVPPWIDTGALTAVLRMLRRRKREATLRAAETEGGDLFAAPNGARK